MWIFVRFYFGLAHEPINRTKKLRVVVASVVLLRRVRSMVQRGEEPKLKRDYHRQRWLTVKNMSDLYFDKKHWENNPLREIVLCLPADDKLTPTSSSYSVDNELTDPQQSHTVSIHVPGHVAPKQRGAPG
jgi:hypothetical protein